MENEEMNLDLVINEDEAQEKELVTDSDSSCCCDAKKDPENLDPEWHVRWNGEEDVEDLGGGIRLESAIITSQEFNSLSLLSSECRKQIYDIIQKSDLDKEKIKDRLERLQVFLAATEKRADELMARIERLTGIKG